MSIDYKSLGKSIKKFRLEKGWNQQKLAEKSGVEPSNISHIERSATKVSLPTLVNIANALEVSLDELVCDSLIKNEHVNIKRIDEMIQTCSSDEIDAIVEMTKVTINILRKSKEEKL